MNQLEKAVEISKELLPILMEAGLYIGLTGGVLYKEGERKDIDFLIYRNTRFTPLNDIEVAAVISKHPKITSNVLMYGRVVKAVWDNQVSLDFIIPEAVDGEYIEHLTKENGDRIFTQEWKDALDKQKESIPNTEVLTHPHNGSEIEVPVQFPKRGR